MKLCGTSLLDNIDDKIQRSGWPKMYNVMFLDNIWVKLAGNDYLGLPYQHS